MQWVENCSGWSVASSMPLFHRISCKQYIGALNGEKASTITMVINSDINSLAPVAGGRFLPPKDFGFKVAAMPTPSQTLTERPGMNSCRIDPKQIDSGFKVLQVVSQDRRLIYLFMHFFFHLEPISVSQLNLTKCFLSSRFTVKEHKNK